MDVSPRHRLHFFAKCLIRLLISGHRQPRQSQRHNSHRKRSARQLHHEDNSTTPFRACLHRNHPADTSQTTSPAIGKAVSLNQLLEEEMRSVTFVCLVAGWHPSQPKPRSGQLDPMAKRTVFAQKAKWRKITLRLLRENLRHPPHRFGMDSTCWRDQRRPVRGRRHPYKETHHHGISSISDSIARLRPGLRRRRRLESLRIHFTTIRITTWTCTHETGITDTTYRPVGSRRLQFFKATDVSTSIAGAATLAHGYPC